MLGRRAGDAQQLLPTLARVAHIAAELGDGRRAATLVDEFLKALESRQGVGFAISCMHQLSWTLTALGRGPELAAVLSGATVPWARAATAYAEGDPAAAADICAEIGAITEEAYARLAAARLLVEQRRRAEGDEQLRRALAFYRSVGASRYVREGEGLLAASA